MAKKKSGSNKKKQRGGGSHEDRDDGAGGDSGGKRRRTRELTGEEEQQDDTGAAAMAVEEGAKKKKMKETKIADDDESGDDDREEEEEEEHMQQEEEEEAVVQQDDTNDDAEDEEEEGDADDREAVGEEDEEEAEPAAEESKPAMNVVAVPLDSDGRYRNKQRCLILCSRGVTARYRHLLEDLRALVPHHKRESKLDPGRDGTGKAVNEICQVRSCNTVLFLECKKRQDAYLWLGRVAGGAGSGGPSAKFHVSNVHTMDELKLTGNCMKGSRPILSFDESFGRLGHLKLLKELFVDVFGTPRGHPKSKPFVDRVMQFCYADKRIWVRNYQILEEQPTTAMEAHRVKKDQGREKTTSLVEIGPRFVLNPIRIFRGSFGGQTLFHNPDFVSPNEIRAMERRSKGRIYEDRKRVQERRQEWKEDLVLPEDPLDSVFRDE